MINAQSSAHGVHVYTFAGRRTISFLAAIAVACTLPLRAADTPDAAIERGKDFIAVAEYKKAERELRWAMDRLKSAENPLSFSAASNLGVALYYQGQFHRAEAAYQQALAMRANLPA